MSTSPAYQVRMRRPVLFLLLALAALLVAVGVRLVRDQGIGSQAQTAAPERPLAALSTEATISRMQERLRKYSDDTFAYAQLGLALLQRVRENGDAALYVQAQQAFDEALKRDPKQLDALMGQGILALARHDFAGALVWAEEARAINPFRAEILGIMVDAQVELGRYTEAVDTLQKMVDMRPDLSSYSRVSYLRELHGQVDGAIEAMQSAVDAGVPSYEGTLWTQVQLGNLYFNRGDVAQAEKIYRKALSYRNDYVPAVAGVAKVLAARGEFDQAIDTYDMVVQRLPLPEYLIALGEVYERIGQMEEARKQYGLVEVIQQLNAGAGMNVDLELAWFNSDHGNVKLALEQARAAYEVRPTIYAADALAWALYRNGAYDEARQYSQEALRLDTKDAKLHYHAGVIAYAMGDMAAARSHLEQALAINPGFSVLYADQARELLEEVKGE